MFHPGKVALAVLLLIGSSPDPAARGQDAPPGDSVATFKAEARAAKDA